MHHQSYSVFKKLKLATKKSIVFTLIFLFAFSPLEPVFAEEAPVPLNIEEQVLPAPQPDTAASALFDSALNSINSRPSPGGEQNVVLPDEVLKMLDIPGNNAASSNIAIPKDSAGKIDNASKKQIELYGDFNKKSALSPEFSAASSGNQLIGGGNKPTTFQGLPTDVQFPSIKNNTGALNYGYALAVPPGRNGLEPDLNLSYDSQTLDDSGLFGYGWSVNIPYIERINKKGTDKLYSENYFSSSLTGELAAMGGTSYGSKVDNGEFLKYEFSGNAWVVTDKKGTKYKFGMTASSRQDNPANAANVYKWMLDEIRDTNDNFINYSYYKNSGQIYPYKINYTGNGAIPGIFEVEFLRQTRADALTSYKSGFAVKTLYRISEVRTKISGLWVKRYIFAYMAGNNAKRSLLKSVTESGKNEAGVIKTLPSMMFEYTGHVKGWTKNTTAPINNFPLYLEFNYSSGSIIDTGVKISDVNGDALPDMIYSLNDNTDNTNYQSYYLNRGGFSNPSGPQQPGWIFATPSGFDIPENFANYTVPDPGTRLADVNGDRFMDIVKSDSGGSGVYFGKMGNGDPAINLGGNIGASNWGAFDVSWPVPVPFKDAFNKERFVKIIDINGDGYNDILDSFAGVKNAYLNTGTGWILNTAWGANIPFEFGKINATGFENEENAGLEIADINNDGLPDFVYSFTNAANVWQKKVYLNNGSGWTLSTAWIPPISFGSAAAGRAKGIRIADVNSDGFPDIIQSDGTANNTYINTGAGWTLAAGWTIPAVITPGTLALDLDGNNSLDLVQSICDLTNSSVCVPNRNFYSAEPGKSDFLSKINYNNNYSGTVQISYSTSANNYDGAWTMNEGPNIDVVSSLAYSASDSFIPNDYHIDYDYHGGGSIYDLYNRKFLGFWAIGQTYTTQSSVLKRDTYYYQEANQPDRNRISKAGKPYMEYWYSYDVNNYNNYSMDRIIFYKYENFNLGSGRNFVDLTKKVDFYKYDYANTSNHEITAETYIYDASNGNVIQETQWGRVDLTYTNGMPLESYFNFFDIGTDKIVTNYAYASNAVSGVSGLLSQESVFDQNNLKAKETRYYYDGLALGEAGKGNLTKEERFKSGTTYVNSQKAYNAYGLVTQDTDPLGNITQYAYDSYNLFPAAVTNPLNQATQYVYDYSSGRAKQVTDSNGYVFQTVYDGLDRVVEEKQPDITVPTTLVTKTKYVYTDNVVPKRIKKTNYLDSVNAVDTYYYFDGFGQLRQTRQETETAGTFSVKSYIYSDGYIQLLADSLPYLSLGTSATHPLEGLVVQDDVNKRFTLYFYDSLDRIKRAYNYTQTLDYQYPIWKTIITDPKGNTKELYHDAYGNLSQVDEHNGTDIYTTAYTYNSLGNLTRITDALGNIRNFTYDGLGQRLAAEDLHAPSDTTFGQWLYSYDANGNLQSATDPNGQTVNYSYDTINRVLTEDYTADAGTEISYNYDTCLGGQGKLCSVAKTGVVQAYEYNPLGLVKKETSTIDAAVYTTSYAYNRAGGNLSIINPDNSEIKYTYNAGGLLEKVQRKESGDLAYKNVINNFNYSPLGQIIYQEYSNGAKTTNVYDAGELYRLKSKATVLANGTRVQDISYIYDANGNITKIIDASQTNSAKTVDYAYDNLDRLLSAIATGAANGQNYTEIYVYDAIGNITNKNGIIYAYLGNTGTSYAHPHAATSIGSTAYSYDKNGNLLTGDGLTNTWDYNNRLTKTIKGTNTVSYAYNASGQRVKYTPGSVSIIYPTANYNITGTSKTKHIFANGQTVATITGSGATAKAHSITTDHLTGSNIVTSSTGAMEELTDYYSYGDIRLDEKSGTFTEQRKYGGHEYDGDTGLSYMNARYYNGKIGRFVSTDPAYLAVGDNADLKSKTGLDLQSYLSDPQNFNSYSYARNNPLVYIDETGEFILPLMQEKTGFVAFPTIGEMKAELRNGWNNVLAFRESVGQLAEEHPTAYNFLVNILSIRGGGVKGGKMQVPRPKSLTEPISGRMGNIIPRMSSNNLPQYAQEALSQYEANGFKNALQGYEGGRIFKNNEGYLPSQDKGYYREWDVKPFVSPRQRGTERFVTGKNGEVYWTDTHYGQVKPGVEFYKLK